MSRPGCLICCYIRPETVFFLRHGGCSDNPCSDCRGFRPEFLYPCGCSVRRGSVRRAKLYYLRDKVGKAARVKELRTK